MFKMLPRHLSRIFTNKILTKNVEFYFSFSINLVNLLVYPVRLTSNCKNQISYNIPNIMKLDSSLFHSVITEEVKRIYELFHQNGFEIRIAGGAVRDLLLGIKPKDLDFATTATPNEMKEIFSKNEIRLINVRGESHGTITPRINETNFEVTTLRIDKITNGRHAVVEFTKDWYLDASRRDLTINSMFLDLDGTVYDYFNGYEDLKNRRIVFVGNASERIQEDYLRILRYFRFYGRIADKSDNHTEEAISAITKNASGLNKISGERLWTELSKIISGNHGVELLKKIISLNLGSYIGLPDICNVKELDEVADRLKKYDLTVEPVTVLCALLNQESDMDTLWTRLKLSGFHRDLGYFIISNRNSENILKNFRFFQSLIVFAKKPGDYVNYIKEFFKYHGDIEKLKKLENWKIPRFPLSGTKILEKGIVDGQQIRFVTEKLKELWVESDFTITAENLENLISETAAKYEGPKKMKKNKKQKIEL